jgi:2-polyprenyl-6-methoxyphenol hydroxylase-like FAD-dependent oxidoreductase
VAADGANSKIRASLRPKDTLQYAGAVSITGNAKFTDGLPAIVKEDHGMILGGGGNCLFVSPIDDHSAVWSVSFLESKMRKPLQGDDALRAKDEILAEAQERGKAFIEPFETMLAATDPTTLQVFNAVVSIILDKTTLRDKHCQYDFIVRYELTNFSSLDQDKQPINHSELTNKSVVFVGDANHAVSPFAGNGANMALMDGVDIATALRENKDAKTALEAFDKSSTVRSKRTVNTSHWTIAIAHSTGWRLAMYKILLHFINFLMSF